MVMFSRQCGQVLLCKNQPCKHCLHTITPEQHCGTMGSLVSALSLHTMQQNTVDSRLCLDCFTSCRASTDDLTVLSKPSISTSLLAIGSSWHLFCCLSGRMPSGSALDKSMDETGSTGCLTDVPLLFLLSRTLYSSSSTAFMILEDFQNFAPTE